MPDGGLVAAEQRVVEIVGFPLSLQRHMGERR
jgi:hypothetical protein